MGQRHRPGRAERQSNPSHEAAAAARLAEVQRQNGRFEAAKATLRALAPQKKAGG
jgi:hypothetical protein